MTPTFSWNFPIYSLFINDEDDGDDDETFYFIDSNVIQ